MTKKMKDIIEDIDKYLSDISIYIEDMNSELLKNEIRRDTQPDTYSIINYFRNEINYSIDKFEIHCRALRDKLNEQ
jgi:translation elongation factor EF-1beta